MLKVDTKEKFSVVRFTHGVFTVNVAEELTGFVTKQLQTPLKNVIVDFEGIGNVENQSLIDLTSLHKIAYAHDASFVLCHINDVVKNKMNELDLLEVFNITPTESEAWDMVQMEDIERELLRDE